MPMEQSFSPINKGNLLLSRLAVKIVPLIALTSTALMPTAAHAAGSTPTLKWQRAFSQAFEESSPLVTNLDGQNDVVVGNKDGKLYAAKSSDGSDVAGWPRATGNGIDSSP